MNKRLLRLRRGWLEMLAVAGLVALVLVGVGVYAATRGGSDRGQTSGVVAAVAMATISGTSIPETGTPVEDEGIATYRALLTTTPVYVAPKPTGTIVLPTQEPLPPLPTGVSSYVEGPFSPSEFHAQNEWQGQASISFVMVFAGIEREQATTDGGPSAVRVYTIATDDRGTVSGQTVFIGDVLAPSDHGALTITGTSGDVLHLQAVDGAVFDFDVATQMFK